MIQTGTTVEAHPEKQRASRLEAIGKLLDEHLPELTQWEKNFLIDIKFWLQKNTALSRTQVDKYREIRKRILRY